MTSSVILVTSYDPSFLAIFEHLLISEAHAGNQPIAFDITPILSVTIDSYHRGILRAARLDYPGHDIETRLIGTGARYVRVDSTVSPADLAPLDGPLEEALEMAMESALITFSRTDRPKRGRRSVETAAEHLRREGRIAYRRVAEFCVENPSVSLAYVVNGRFPNQKLSQLAFEDAGVQCRHIEKGEGVGRAYVQDYAPQDRLLSQATVDEVLNGLSRDEVNEIADVWLAARAPSAQSINRYSALWDESLPPSVAVKKKSGKPIVGFFTSSQDEFLSVGAEWHIDSWKDQFDAFDQILARFEGDGYATYLRVHPNLATKEHSFFKRERDGIRWLQRRHPELTVIWHDHVANTYSLVEASDVVVVWASTVGLEASARGIPVWAASATRYGLTADVREVLSTDELAGVGALRWAVNTDGAKRFIAYLVLRDQQMSTDLRDWIPWDANNPPLAVTLAAIAVSGGISRPAAAVLSLVDVYRHRGLRANLRSLRRR